MPAAIRKPLIFIVGSSLVITGAALLVLPGPGWAAIFLGFAVLATEFAFAAHVRDWLKKEVLTVGRNGKKAGKAIWQTLKRKLK
jgi:uncharacterized protein (TIGR02611 family)